MCLFHLRKLYKDLRVQFNAKQSSKSKFSLIRNIYHAKLDQTRPKKKFLFIAEICLKNKTNHEQFWKNEFNFVVLVAKAMLNHHPPVIIHLKWWFNSALATYTTILPSFLKLILVCLIFLSKNPMVFKKFLVQFL